MILDNITQKGMGYIRKYRELIEKKQEEKCRAQKKAFFLHALNKAKEDVILKRNNFENVTDERLLDCCIVELTAAEARLNYYLSLAKSEKMVNEDYLNIIFKKQPAERGTAI